MIMVASVAIAAARFVFTNTTDASSAPPSVMETVDAPLKPNQQNHRINTPSAPSGIL